MSTGYRTFIPKTEVKSGSASLAVEDSKKKSNLLKDNSWIRRNEEEDDPVDRDPNFGKAVLTRLKSNEYPDSTSSEKDPTSSSTTDSTSVQNISKRFSGTQDQAVKSTSPPSYDKAVASKRTTDTKRPTETFTERVFSDVKSSSKPKPGTLPPKPKTSGGTEGTSSKGDYTRTYSSQDSYPTTTTRTRSVSSPKPPETKTDTDSLKDKSLEALSDDFGSSSSSSDYSKTYSSSSPNSSTTTTTTTTTRTRSVSSTKTPETPTMKTFTDTTKDRPLDALADDLISLPSTTTYSPRNSEYSRTYSSSSPNSSTTTTTRTRSVSSPKPSETTTVTTYTDTLKDRSLDDLSDDFGSRTSSNVYSSRDSDYRRSYTSTSPNSSTITTTRTRSVSSPKPSETTTLTTYTDTLKDRNYSRTYSSLDSPTSTTRNSRTYSSGDYTPTVRTSSYSVSTDPSYDYNDGLYKSKSYTSLPRESSSASYTKTSSLLENSRSGSYSDISSRSSSTAYPSSERAVTARDICTYCHKPMSIEAKMILDDLQIHCHATCFKCEVCSASMGHLKAGDTMWIYHRTVHCERCFETTRDKWHR